MRSLILVHGSFHGPWCWERLKPYLSDHYSEIRTPDLAAGAQRVAADRDPDLSAYAEIVCGEIDASPDPVVLVAHSMGGIVATQAAEWRHSRIDAIVYVNGLLLRSGESLTSFLSDQADPAIEDLVLQNMVLSGDGRIATFPRQASRPVFYNACSDGDADWAADRLRPQPTAVYASKLDISPERCGAVRRFYIEGLRDRAVPISFQRVMTAQSPCERVITLDADHSPFLSYPAELASAIQSLVG